MERRAIKRKHPSWIGHHEDTGSAKKAKTKEDIPHLEKEIVLNERVIIPSSCDKIMDFLYKLSSCPG